MSLLMDALRKAEEAKKKAELTAKSALVAKDTAADTDAGRPLDIEIQFESPPQPEPLIDDLSASLDSSADALEPRIFAAGKAEAAGRNEHALPAAETGQQPAPVPTTREAVPDSTQTAQAAMAKPTVSGSESTKPIVSKPIIAKPVVPKPVLPKPVLSKPTPAPVAADTYSIDYVATRAGERAGTAAAQAPVVAAVRTPPPGSITQRIRDQQQARITTPDLDTELADQDRRSARTVFTAKRKGPQLGKNLQLTAISIAAVLVVAVGIYFYISLQTTSGIAIPIADFDYQQSQRELTAAELELTDAELGVAAVEFAQTVAAEAAPVNPEPAPIDAPEPDIAPETQNQAPVSINNSSVAQVTTDVANAAPQTPADAPATTPVAVASTVADTDTAIARGNAMAAVASNTAATLQPESIAPEALVSFTRRDTAPTSNPLILDAYSAYQNGDQAQAERLYREALVAAPLNRSALIGLAAIAASRNDTAQALDLYSRLLARDPSDPVAKAGLLEIMPSGDLQQQEMELRRLQNQHPDMAPLAYAVGNFMASQQRWSEAQQAYFSALQLAKNDAQGGAVNPDYAFNLAVSLEHLGQSRPASNYYREALTQAQSHPAGFELDIVRQRLGSMESAGNE